MSWTQWDIANFDFPAPVGEHPMVIISNPDRAAGAKLVNVLYCNCARWKTSLAGPRWGILCWRGRCGVAWARRDRRV